MWKRKVYSLIILLVSLFLLAGCNNDKGDIASISANSNSEYENTFLDLDLGILFDFNLELPRADESWVIIWVEGYKNGQKMEPSHLLELSYGASPNQHEEGNMGFGMVNPLSDNGLYFLYSPAANMKPQRIDIKTNAVSGGSVIEYAIGEDPIALEADETKVLAVYRQSASSILKNYDFEDEDAINEIIEEHETVLVLKIKVSEDK